MRPPEQGQLTLHGSQILSQPGDTGAQTRACFILPPSPGLTPFSFAQQSLEG